jgi:hypothetical protein
VATPREPDAPPSGPDGEGVRVVRKSGAARARAWPWALAAIAVVGVVAWWLRVPAMRGGDAVAAGAPRGGANVSGPIGPSASADSSRPPVSHHKQAPMPGDDPNDLASYIGPGDPEPTGAEVIEALQEAGVRTGIGAFNPPGTSPPLVGLAVPDDFDLPDGYVRHHQVTDEGVPIEPILMFSPDFTLYDDRGRPVAMPADRVVPPSLAPPGLPLRRIQIPPR